MREVDANETSGELGSAFGGTLVGLSQLSIPKLDPLIESSILFPLVSVNLEYHDEWCALKSPRIRVSGVIRRCSIYTERGSEDCHWLSQDVQCGPT